MKKYTFLLAVAVLTAMTGLAQETVQDMEESGNHPDITLSSVQKTIIPDFFTDGVPEGGVLLVPESTGDRVMAFDPETGALLNPDFIPDDGVTFATPIKAILNASQTSLLISDQLGDVVYEFDFDGNLMGVFAPAGGVNNSILDNVRGTCLKPNGNLLVTVGSGNNTDCVAEFDQQGNYLGRFIEAASGGLDSPFDVLYRPDYDDYLVSGYSSDAIHRYDSDGNYIEDFAAGLDALEQLAFSLEGNILCAGYSADGVYEFANDGTMIGFYPGVNGIRGVYELPDGMLLVTDGLGVHKFSRTDGIVETVISGASARFITFVNPVFTGCQHTLALYDEVGDGWNGGALDVYVAGTLIYEDLTLVNGTGPEEYFLDVVTTDEVTFIYTAGANPSENYYLVKNHIGDVVFEDGMGGEVPVGGSYTADCDAIPTGTIGGIVLDENSQPVEAAKITAGDYAVFTLADGTYTMEVATGIYTVTAEKKGFITQMVNGVEVEQNAVVTLDFSLEKVPPFTIPFTENWQEVSFDDQLWGFEPEQGNWQISTSDDYGNPAPGARFNWSPSQTGYSYTLSSYDLSISDRYDKLALQFDLHLNNYSSQTVEGMEVMLFDNGQWVSIHNFDNQKGEIPFTTYFFNISEYVTGNIIKIGFRAYGENSFNINGWGLDNIYVVEQVGISGTVTRLSTGEPIENAEVTIGNYSPLLTNSNGHYSLDLVPGTYNINASKSGYNQQFLENIEINSNLVLDITLTAPTLEPDLEAVVEVLETGQSADRELTLSNNGDGPVNWIVSIEFGPEDKLRIPAFNGPLYHGKGELSEGFAPEVRKGPDFIPEVKLSGSLAYGFEMYPGKKLISLDTDLPGSYLSSLTIGMDIYAADFDNEGNFYAINNDDGNLFLIDTETGDFTLIGPSIAATDLAYDKLNGIMYAVDYNSPDSELYTINTETGSATLVGNCGTGLIISLACDGNGNLWGFNVGDDSFYFIDKVTGAKTLIGPVGFDGNYAQSMAWDPKTDNIYMAAFNNTELRGELRLVDIQTGASMLLGIFPEGAEVTGFGFPASYSPWISLSPTSGTLSPDKITQDINIHFDASDMMAGDLKQAALRFYTAPELDEIVVDAALGVGQQKIDLYPGWSGISTYRDLTGWPVEEMPSEIIGGELLIMIGNDGFFWPAQNLNLLGNWNPYEGYKLKMIGDGYLLADQPELEDKTVFLEEGLSYMPVLSKNPVEAMLVFDQLINDGILEFAFDIYTGQVLWPAGGLIPPNPNPFILNELYPGVGYLVRLNAPATIDFNVEEYLTNTIRYIPKLNIDNPWNRVINTGVCHLMSINTSAFADLEYGDIIGVFNDEDRCCGITVYRDNEYQIPLTVFGDDDMTSAIDGMKTGEEMQFRIFRNQEVLEATAEFDPSLPDHSGVYALNGQSGILKFSTESFGIYANRCEPSIYPNPSSGLITVQLTNSAKAVIEISNTEGQQIYSGGFTQKLVINLQPYNSGVYIVRVLTPENTFTRKIIIH